ncbi:NAD-dependent epimerase/dehydratase family protein [Clostridium tagluense]|uniref:NAD-dependent epimerase/dehydratase family protein n=1 Tax=Clostridium tagluense TaxID=360422 RepID=UPI001CF2883F|nr:NAD-dependent epimerase/dehydratase family protein [Clostridium tagluense]MCB2312024.1 NAD-dependent epimerase/dehydratase family protein [Clostridium tagluense]MCB2316611.1 NAD-dependent epimerase/dehydratase family protein [Clostridium tagluense]MCB2321453.1 NAD-dependent epimerase/dehydratase family protein [Clostridium tagluense]MCB2326465.1 NAD-dependent epimerase/dehydratase family protein [Clostridium tagluense]MCB2331203.1 NAD-dependent epimerase/dehydratase family protein [Clostrid
MKVLITGGAGFIGSNVVDLLIKEGHSVVVVDNLSQGKKENVHRGAVFYKCDILDIDKLSVIFSTEQPKVVIHNAAQIDVQTSLKEPALDSEINIKGTINILECCIKFGVKKIIYPSSAAVYGNPKYLPVDENHQVEPISFYGISKHTPEHYIKTYAELYNIKYTIFRYANVYGIRQDPKGEGGVVSIFIDKLLNNKAPIIFGDGNQTRDFVYVKNIAKANLLALNSGDNQILNISTEKPVTVNELLKIMEEIFNSNLEAIHENERGGDIRDSHLKNEKARNLLNWKNEYSLVSGLSETCLYYKEIYEAENEMHS